MEAKQNPPPLPPTAFRPGEVVVVRSAAEILATLDDQGTKAGLPFMPEMMEHIGKRFVVSRKVEKTCVDASPYGMKEFNDNDVVFLEQLRCDGASHGGCGRACMLFWKTAWLAAAGTESSVAQDDGALETLRKRLITKRQDGRYMCQSSDLEEATHKLSRFGRLWKCVRNVTQGNNSVLEMGRMIVKPAWARLWLRFFPRWPSGTNAKCPAESLSLQPGDWVEVKSVEEIKATLDATGKNRGLQFAYDLAWCCGKKFKIRSRLEHLIVERTGKALDVRNTVLLEGITCPCRCVIGGCGRADYIYWREIWLRKIPVPHASGMPDSGKSVPRACCSSAKICAIPETVGK